MTTEEVLIQPYLDKFRAGVAKYKEVVAIYFSIPSPSQDTQDLYVVNTQILAELYQALGPYLSRGEKAEIESLIEPVEGLSGLGFLPYVWFAIGSIAAVVSAIVVPWVDNVLETFKNKSKAELTQAEADKAAIEAGIAPSWIEKTKSFFEKVLGISPGTVITVAALIVIAPYVIPEIKRMLKERKS